MEKSYFKMSELCHSDTAEKEGIKNIPVKEEFKNLMEITIPKMNIIREFLGVPIKVNSGYRCPELNKRVGGVSNSYHVKGLAVDGVPLGMSVREAWEKIKNSNLSQTLDQCILYEKRGFIHFGFTNKTPRQQFFTK